MQVQVSTAHQGVGKARGTATGAPDVYEALPPVQLLQAWHGVQLQEWKLLLRVLALAHPLLDAAASCALDAAITTEDATCTIVRALLLYTGCLGCAQHAVLRLSCSPHKPCQHTLSPGRSRSLLHLLWAHVA